MSPAGDPTGPAARREGDLALRLLRRGLAGMGRLGVSLPAPLSSAWSEVYRDWCANIHPAVPEQHFLIPTGTPAFELLAWVAEAVLERSDSEPAWQAGEAMLAWYFALRIQDDLVDEGAPRELAFLEQVLAVHATRAMVSAAGDAPAMLAFQDRLVRDFASTAMADARQRAEPDFVWDGVAIARQGRKYLPMAGPLGALLIRAGRGDDLDRLARLVEELSTGLQLTNDLFGAGKDLARGERSPYLAAMGLRPGLHGAADLEPAVRRGVRSGAHQAYQDRIEASLQRSLAVLPLPSPRLEEHVERRVADLRAVCTGQRLDALLNTRILVADLEITRRCDLGCPHCFVRQQAEPGAELDTGLVLEILDELAGYGCHLHLTGGEPFLHPGIWTILERAVALGIRDLSINTSGTLLDCAALDRLAAVGARAELLVSLDGPPGVHDRARGEGRAARALAVIRGARERGVSATPATVLTRELVCFGVEAWHAWLAERLGQVGKLALWSLFMRPGAAHPRGAIGHPLGPTDLLEAARAVARLLERGEPVVVGDFPVFNVALAHLGVPEERLWQCGAGGSRLCVQADGLVSPCHPLRLELGRLQPGGVGGFVARALAHPHAERLASRDFEGCGGCAHQAYCGGCQAVVAGMGLPAFACDPSCGPLRSAIARLTEESSDPAGA